MSAFVKVVVSVGAAVFLSGCDPVTERTYLNEGAGVDLYTPERAKQAVLLNDYINFVCQQAGSSCGSDWAVFVQAGMNDIDLRCDGFLTWIDAQRRDKEPVIAEISAINTAVHSIMTVTGSNPEALNIVTAAFGLASATYANWNSRLLIAVNQSTIQEVVYGTQGAYREKIKNWQVTNQATAIYLLRNYLRLCMPTTIEANINTTTTLVHSGATVPPKKSLVVDNTAQPKVTRAAFFTDTNSTVLETYLDPNNTGTWDNDRVQSLAPYLAKLGLAIRKLPLVVHGSEYTTQRQQLVKALKDAGKL
ncbi:hypothetical protein [Bradyrhizobium genosp. P]|uniref:hypothetical protein n=1 Tax=Bradyrhizobium genosp. P TaxID=83641 RepID=UPI003CEDBC65